MFARIEQKAWKKVDYVQNYDTPHTDYMAPGGKHGAKVDDNRNDYS